MINVSHNADNWWSWNKLILWFFIFLKKFCNNINLLFMLTYAVELESNLFCCIVIYLFVNSNNLTL